MQAQLHICEVQYSNFVVWILQGIHVERIELQNNFFSLNVALIEKFYKQAILPELLGKWYTKMPIMPPACSDVGAQTSGSSTHQASDSANIDLWCYCWQPENDHAMIGCDYPDCSIQWFHLDCLKLSTSKLPKGDWYCPDCQKKFSGRRPRNTKK